MSAVGRFQSGNGKSSRLRRGDAGRNGQLREDATVTFAAERELAGLLGVSRITLREAIRALQQAGYVESRRGRFGGAQ